MAGEIIVGGNIIASHTGVEGAGEVTLQNVTLGDSAVPSRSMNFRNKFINGDMQVHQRGNGTATAGTFTYATDRWYVYCVGEGCSYSQVDTPSGKALEVIPDSGTTNQIIAQKIENVNCLDLGGKTVTISGKVYIDDATGVTFNTNIYSASSTNASYGSKVDFSSDLISDEYAYFSEQVTLPADAVNGVEVDFSFLNAGGRTIHVTDLQFEEGPVATPFEYRPLSIEEHLCQRYYQIRGVGADWNGNEWIGGNITLSPTMRAIPTRYVEDGQKNNVTLENLVGIDQDKHHWGWQIYRDSNSYRAYFWITVRFDAEL